MIYAKIKFYNKCFADDVDEMTRKLKNLHRLKVCFHFLPNISTLSRLENLQELLLNTHGNDHNSEMDPAKFQFNRDVFRLMPQLKMYFRIDFDRIFQKHPHYDFNFGLEKLAPCSMEEFSIEFNGANDV